jgi:hypothetical protein
MLDPEAATPDFDDSDEPCLVYRHPKPTGAL